MRRKKERKSIDATIELRLMLILNVNIMVHISTGDLKIELN